jgi:hypothetical protein
MNEVNKITISQLPGLFPTFAFQDKKYVLNRPIKIGFYEESFKTDKKFKTIEDNWYRERNVQNIVYDKYKIIIPAKENQGVGLLKYADIVSIELRNQDADVYATHTALVLSLTESYQGESLALFYTLEYADINKLNYVDYKQPIINYLKSDVIDDNYNTSTLVKLTLGSIPESAASVFYTKLLPELDITDMDLKEEKVNSLNITTYVGKQKLIRARFYLGETAVNLFKLYINRSVGVNGFYATLLNPPTTYTSIEMMKPAIQRIDAAIDLFQVDIEMKYQNILTNIYE